MTRKGRRPGDTLWMPHGMIGFPGLTRYRLLAGAPDTPFFVLESEERSGLRFPLIDPAVARPEYALHLEPGRLDEMEIDDPEDALVFAVLFAPGNAKEITINLRAPVVVGKKTRVAKQILLDDETLPVRALLSSEFRRERGEARLS